MYSILCVAHAAQTKDFSSLSLVNPTRLLNLVSLKQVVSKEMGELYANSLVLFPPEAKKEERIECENKREGHTT